MLFDNYILRNYVNFNTKTKLYDKIFIVLNFITFTKAFSHLPNMFTNVIFLINIFIDSKCTFYKFDCENFAEIFLVKFETMAVECVFFFCTRTCTAFVINDAVVETEVKRFFGQGNWIMNIFDGVIIDLDKNCKLRNTFNFHSSPCSCAVESTFIMALIDYFWGFWNGTMTETRLQQTYSINDVLS